MPELPEVETVVRELRPFLRGRLIESIRVYWDKTYQNRSGKELIGREIHAVDRKGKYIIIQLSGTFLIIHLRMTGRLIMADSNKSDQIKHLRMEIHFENGQKLIFSDQRKFGRIYHVDDPEAVIGKIGPDALSSEMAGAGFTNSLSKSGQIIKSFLLSQKQISGVGNIYADESLFKARIHPSSTCKNIPRARRNILFSALRETLESAIDNMGTTISDYRDANGLKGKNQTFLLVYQRQGKPCINCKTIIVKEKIASRGTHYCPRCQKLYADGEG